MEATVVIGANYGDEGKGLLTDYHCSRLGKSTIAVRFNGGSQAGHTVTTPEKRRHVFSHFASGTFAGATTFLSKYFIVNPTMVRKEMETLQYQERAFADMSCKLTTIYDMILNQLVEKSRNTDRHGSCGLGINETVNRCQYSRYSTSMTDTLDLPVLKEKLHLIREEYVPIRMRELGLDKFEIPEVYVKLFTYTDRVIDVWMKEVDKMRDVIYTSSIEIIPSYKNIVFEGAQGLQLDEDSGNYPFVTRSKTGLCNVIQMSKYLGIDYLNVNYVTRCYFTRHGNGPLENEKDASMYPFIEDETNKFNDYQGSLRFATLDLDVVKDAITQDEISVAKSGIVLNRQLAVTCLDHVGDEDIVFTMDGAQQSKNKNDFIKDAFNFMECEGYASTGPRRIDVWPVLG